MDIIDLQKNLDNLSVWRKKELSQAKALSEFAVTQDTKKYLCRVWVLVMYAHCDNFLKESSKIYIKYLKNNPSVKYDYKLMWLIFKSKNLVTEGKQNSYQSLDDHNMKDRKIFFDAFDDPQIFDRRSFQYKSLRFICDWVVQVDFNYDAESDFCKTLKEKRDAIAHGEESYIENIGDCIDWHYRTIQFIDLFKDALLAGALRLE